MNDDLTGRPNFIVAVCCNAIPSINHWRAVLNFFCSILFIIICLVVWCIVPIIEIAKFIWGRVRTDTLIKQRFLHNDFFVEMPIIRHLVPSRIIISIVTMFLVVWKRKQLLYDERDLMINYIPFEKTARKQSGECEWRERTYPCRSRHDFVTQARKY